MYRSHYFGELYVRGTRFCVDVGAARTPLVVSDEFEPGTGGRYRNWFEQGRSTMCSRLAFSSVCRATILSPKPSLAGSGLKSVPHPLPAARWFLLLDSPVV